MGRSPALIGLVALLAGCDDGRSLNDAGPGDGVTPGIDADLVDFSFTGTYLDWDSTAAEPCPIAGAKWTARYDDQRFATTDAAGTFTIRLASYTPLLDLKQPTTISQCANPQGAYPIRGIAITPPAVFYGGGAFVARSLTMGRATAFYASFGSSLDPARANLLVHVNGAHRAISISSASDPPQAFDGTAWAAGNTGVDVYFPNIALATDSMMTTVTVAGGALGTGSVPLEPTTITYMPVIAN